MIPFKTFSSLASKVGGLLSGETSSSVDGRQNAAAQRKDLDIIKSQEAQLSGGLDNVVRVPSTDGTGVSQAPAIDAIRKDALMAGEQPSVALQEQPVTAVSASPPSDADGIRMHLMDAVPGGKVGTHSGQVERFFELEMRALPEWFVQELKDEGGSKVFKAKPQALRDHYERVSKKVFAGMTYGKAKKPLHATPYCFRHALATELRTSGWSVDEIAAVLGQRSADTQSHYGFRKGGKRKPKTDIQTSIVAGSVTTTSPVRPQKNSWAQASVEIRSGKTHRSPKL